MSRLLSGHYTFIERSGGYVSPTVVVESSDSKTLSERKKLVLWKKIDSGRV